MPYNVKRFVVFFSNWLIYYKGWFEDFFRRGWGWGVTIKADIRNCTCTKVACNNQITFIILLKHSQYLNLNRGALISCMSKKPHKKYFGIESETKLWKDYQLYDVYFWLLPFYELSAGFWFVIQCININILWNEDIFKGLYECLEFFWFSNIKYFPKEYLIL